MGKSLKCPQCGCEIEMPDGLNDICMELLENKEFLAKALSSDSLTDEAKKELEHIKSIMDRMDALYK